MFRPQPSERPFYFVLPALGLMAAVALYPLASTFWLSLRHELPIFGISRFVGLAHYAELWHDQRFWHSLANTLYFTLVSVSLEVSLGLGAALLLQQVFPGRGLVRALVLVPWFIPTVVVLIPNFVMMSRMGLVDTFWPLLLIPVSNSTSVAPPFGIFWMRQYIGSAIHDELLEAARIDGASEFGIYSRIVVPTIGPGLAGLAIFAFTLSWNSFLQPLVFLRSPQNLTYPVQLVALQSLTWPLRPTNLIMAGGALSVAPMLLLFVLLQRHFIAGLTAGAVKE